MEYLPVVFRKFPEDDVICFFISLITEGDMCTSYMHFGQHSDVKLDLINELSSTLRYEYEDLLEEVSKIYDEFTLFVIR